MKRIFLSLPLIFNLLSCNSQSNPKITYKEYKDEFQADQYPASIIELYKNEQKLEKLSNREIAIKINADIMLDELIDNILRYNFIQNITNISENSFNNTKLKLTKYYVDKKISDYSEKDIINRTQQWIADSIVLNKYSGRIFYDSFKNIPKPKESYQKMIFDLINKNEIQISDEFLKKEIINLTKKYLKKEDEIECNFNLIESWKIKK